LCTIAQFEAHDKPVLASQQLLSSQRFLTAIIRLAQHISQSVRIELQPLWMIFGMG
jgi:hypothetical protein